MTGSCSPIAAGIVLAGLSATGAAEIRIAGQTFRLPDGFDLEVVAGPPLVERPISADLDDEGRLYVTDSSGSNDKVEKQLEEKPHRVVRLEDTDGDGAFDRSVVFADRLMFPEGALWHEGSLYVAAPPSIWKLTDTDGDGAADRREEWFQGKTLTGCANDLHGPYLGRDGWLYWAKGAFAKQTYERAGRPPFVTRAAHIFRRRPEGGEIEPVMTGGMDNPVEVAFTPEGERIFTTTFFLHPEAGRRDGLVHAIYGGVYGKSHDVIDDHPRTGDLLPVLTHLGAAAPCGLALWESRGLGAEYAGNLFSALFNLHKVMRHELEPDGATFRSRDTDFLVSDSTDFHPTDVLEDADGSLLILDTGGWYKLCCPTSQLAKPDVFGAIYRVRRKGARRLDDPRGSRIAWEESVTGTLAALLDDERPRVRARAIGELARRGRAALPGIAMTFMKPSSVEARRNAVWALTRVEDPSAQALVRFALEDRDPSVRHAAIHSAGLRRYREAVAPLLEALRTAPAPLRRASAEALGRIGEASSVPALLEAASGKPERLLEHSILYALIEIGSPAATRAGLEAGSPHARRAALIALDQMPGGGLEPEEVARIRDSGDPVLAEAASWILGRHGDWGRALVGHYRKRLERGPAEGERAALERDLARSARDPAIQDLLAASLDGPTSSRDARLLALRAMARSGLKTPPPAWAAGITRSAGDADGDVVREAVAAARSFHEAKEGSAGLAEALVRVARNPAAGELLRLQALAGLKDGLDPVDRDLFDLLRAGLDPSKPVEVRAAAAAALSKAKLGADALLLLAEEVKTAGPLELGSLLAAFENAKEKDEALGMKLVQALGESPGLSALNPGALRERLLKFPPSVQRGGEELLERIDVDIGKQRAHLEEIAGAMREGDIRRGQAVFNSPKAACSACHAIGYLGGRVGPDLTKIGQIRTERDLLEAIVYPSVSFTRSYEPVVIATRSGEYHSGVLRKDAEDEVILATGPTTEARIARDEIVEIQPGTTSVMPQGLDGLLTLEELADLIAFLVATKR